MQGRNNESRARPGGVAGGVQKKRHMDNWIYLSSDVVGRADAYELGYGDVCRHPNELGDFDREKTSVIAIDHIFFDDRDEAVLKANGAANRGVTLGTNLVNAACASQGRPLAVQPLALNVAHLALAHAEALFHQTAGLGHIQDVILGVHQSQKNHFALVFRQWLGA
jgi:hypothetical protein